MTAPTPFSEEQLQRLEKLLEAPELASALYLDEAQGYLCAALAGPQPIPEEQWLAEVLGGAEVLLSDAGREAADLFRGFAAQLEAELAAGRPPVLLLYGDEEGAEVSLGDTLSWCQGYLHGVDTAPEDWFGALGAQDDGEDSAEVEYLDELMFTLFVLTGDAEAAAKAAGEEWPLDSELERMQQECEERLPQVVTDIYRFWLAHRGIATIRRATGKIGRNAPCPCGSGKKFKKCCGAT